MHYKIALSVVIIFIALAVSFKFLFISRYYSNDIESLIDGQSSIKSDSLHAEIIILKKTTRFIEIDFILTNKGAKPIRLYERWNSWGSRQWSFIAHPANGAKVKFINPQITWTINSPTSFEIKPHDKQTLHCALLLNEAARQDMTGYHIFTTGDNGEITNYPVLLTGYFQTDNSDKAYKELQSKPNWFGSIISNTVTIDQ